MTSPTRPGAFLVIGAGPGVGLATAKRFAREGHPTGLIGRNAERLQRLSDDIAPAGVPSAIGVADATDAAALTDAIKSITDRIGPPEVLLFSPRPDVAWIKPVLDTSPDDLFAGLGLSVIAAAAAVNLVVPEMRRHGRGTLLFTTGGAAVEPHPDRAVSGVAYAAETVYVRMLHDALAGSGIHAAQLTVVGAIGEGARHEPSTVAEELWQRHVRRDEPLIVLR